MGENDAQSVQFPRNTKVLELMLLGLIDTLGEAITAYARAAGAQRAAKLAELRQHLIHKVKNSPVEGLRHDLEASALTALIAIVDGVFEQIGRADPG